jgi:glycosyltransferase involved in cell wall biosynthesis
MYSDLVSVIIPAWNSERYIGDCLNSVLSQTHENIEIIVVDDGSTDKTASIILSYTDKRIKLVSQRNLGASQAKNNGFSHSKGDFIQYLDSDDILSSDKIQSQVRSLIGKTNSVAVCKTKVFTDSVLNCLGEIDTAVLQTKGTGVEFFKRLMGAEGRLAMVQPNAYLIPRGICLKSGPWFSDLYPCPDEDGEYFSRILLNSNEVIFTEGINYYRKTFSAGSLSTTFSEERAINQLKTTIRKFENLLRIENSHQTREYFKFNLSQIVYQFGRDYPTVVSEAKREMQKYNLGEFRIIGNNNFQLVSNVLGFERALKLAKFKKILNPLKRNQ